MGTLANWRSSFGDRWNRRWTFGVATARVPELAAHVGVEEARPMSAGARGGGESGDSFAGVGSGLLDGTNEAFAAGKAEALAGGIVEKVVGVS